MKKLLLLAVLAFTFTACDVESDEPTMISVLAEVTDIDLPESFEQGESYVIDVTYLLPSACHLPQGINAQRESAYGSGRRKIYVAGVASIEFGAPDCTEESEDLEKTGSFRLLIDEDMPYTFFLWTGVDEAGKSVYNEVEVPVGAPTTEMPE